ncbi:MAG TPA: PIG-L family deacetylase [Rubricoccaceae bacterium]|nr:PIG-L family deacetylase [Rubricoccaceae bacterium]
MRARFALSFLLLPALAAAQADEPAPLVVMNLAAHPDDEDGLTLAYYRHARDAVAYSVLFTRGEGGQNEAGPELYERLGAIRTAETERAARILGTQVFYLNFYDFGFSKHARETFAEWSRPRRGFWDTDAPIISAEAGRDTVTARLVYLIRRLKPDVLFTNHDTTTAWPNAQHGHHQVVGISAWEAFEKAADPTYHPEQLREPGVALWQPQRLFVRRFRPSGGYDVAVPVGNRCAFAGDRSVSCATFAVNAAAEHVSQGFDKFADRFRRDTTYFVLYRSAPGAPPLPEDATDLAAGLPPNAHAHDLSLSTRINMGRASHLPAWFPRFVRAEAAIAVPGQEVRFTWPGGERGASLALSGATTAYFNATATSGAARIRADARPTFPAYRSQYNRSEHTPPVQYVYSSENVDHPSTDAGHVSLEIAPPVVMDLPPAPIRLSRGDNAVAVRVRTYDPAAERVRVRLNLAQVGGRAGSIGHDAVTLTPEDTVAVLHLTLDRSTPPGPYRLTVTAEAEPTSAPAEPYVEWRPADVLDGVRVAEGLRVGFVRSYDRVTEDALRAMGAEVVVLDSAALAEGRFDGLHTIVLDIRAYLVRPDLRQHNGRLLDWVRSGGHLVVGYHKTFEWNPGESGGDFAAQGIVVPDSGFAPYPLRLGRERITYEDAPVALLQPDHVLFRAPHAITESDWAGWVQERGLYFPASYDDRYEELLAINDSGEAPLRGGLLLAHVGEGTYLYSPLVWYRQLEALNPGAWRLFANLVSLPLTDRR